MSRFSFALVGFSLLFTSVFVTSCNDEEPKKNEPNPITISIISPAANTLLIGTVTIDLEVTQEIPQTNSVHTEVFLGTNLIGESDNNIISISYNTKQIEDGVHILKIVATDDMGETEESTLEVEVLNTLLTFSIPEDYLLTNEEVWFFITNNEGDILGVQQGDNNTKLVFETPVDFTEDQGLILHQLNHTYETYEVTTYSTTIAVSYSNITPGNYLLKSTKRLSFETVGTHSITINNIPTTYNKISAPGPHISSDYFSSGGGTKTFNIGMSNNNVNQLYRMMNSSDRTIVPRFINRTNVTVGAQITVDFSEFTEMALADISLGTLYDQVIPSIRTFSDNTRQYVVPLDQYSDFHTNNAKLYYPGNLYDAYLTQLILYQGNKNIFYSKIGSVPSTIKLLNANVTAMSHLGDNLTVTSTGSFDYSRATSAESWTYGSTECDLYWGIVMDDSANKTFTIPTLPLEIIAKYRELSNAVIKFDYVQAYDFDGIDGYNDFLQLLLQSDESLYNHYTESLGVGVNFGGGEEGRIRNKRGRISGSDYFPF